MTVAEFIKELETFDQDLHVFIPGKSYSPHIECTADIHGRVDEVAVGAEIDVKLHGKDLVKGVLIV